MIQIIANAWFFSSNDRVDAKLPMQAFSAIDSSNIIAKNGLPLML